MGATGAGFGRIGASDYALFGSKSFSTVSRSVRHPGSGQSAIAPTRPPPTRPPTRIRTKTVLALGPIAHSQGGVLRGVGAYCSSPVYSASAPAPSPSAASNRQGWASAARSSRPRHARAPRPVGPSTIGRDGSPGQRKGPSAAHGRSHRRSRRASLKAFELLL